MKAFFLRHKKLHIWLLADLVLLAAFWLTRSSRTWMNGLAAYVSLPIQRALGRLCYRTDISIMEVVYVLAILLGLAYAVWSVAAVVRAKGRRGRRAYSAVLGGLCACLGIYAGFCLLWGVLVWTDSFQDLSGITAQPVAKEDLLAVTEYFAQQLGAAADDVKRDEQGLFAESRVDILESSPAV